MEIDLEKVVKLSDQLRAGYLEFHSMVPLASGSEGATIGVWTEEPDERALDDMRLLFGAVRTIKLSRDAGERTCKRLYGDLSTAKNLIQKIGGQAEIDTAVGSIDDLVALANEAPVIQLVNLLITEALEARASDIHLESRAGGMTVRYRIDGVLQDAAAPPRHLQAPIVSRLKIMADLDIAERRVPQDGRMRLSLMDRQVDVRMSSLPSLHGEDVVLRLLDQSQSRMKIEQLGMPRLLEMEFRDAIAQPNGLILVTGPTGSGKSTTLYAAVEALNDGILKIVTAEDPVEYEIEGVTQVQVNSMVGLNFARALRAFLRQDPDVMLVGEIRDSETAEVAAHAAVTGHLVLSTLHTNDAKSAISRLTDLGLPPYMVANVIRAIVAQRLVRQLCAACKQTKELSDKESSKWQGLLKAGEVFSYPVGCDQCRYTGFRGRTGIYEALIVDDRIRDAIVRGSYSVHSDRADSTTNSLFIDGIRLVRQGITAPAEIIRMAGQN